MALCDKSALELSRMLRKRDITSREITDSVFQRMDEKESLINAFITTTRDMAFQQANEADTTLRSGKDIFILTGIPIAIKDILCTRGIKTTCGSKILEKFIPTYNATAVEHVFRHGAVLVGKTNMDEFGMGSSTENSIIGPTHNPLHTEYVAGGSSGGSAAAVAAGETILAIGTDTGGSIRLPAAYCGIVGIKPTYGRVSRYGLISYASSLDQVGAMGRTVQDCAMLLDVIAGYDRLDSTSVDIPKPNFLDSMTDNIKGIKIGLPKEYFIEGLDARIHDHIMKAAALLRKNGAHIVEISLPHTRYAVSTYYLIATAEASSNLARYDGVKYGFRIPNEIEDTISMYEATRSLGFGKEVKRRIMLGTYVLSAGYYDAYYLKAQKVRTLIKEDFTSAFKQADCIIAPVSPCLPFRIGEKMEDPLQMYLVDIYTASLNLSGLPGMSLPCGSVDGLPIGMQIIGRAFDEQTVFNVGYAYERMAGH